MLIAVAVQAFVTLLAGMFSWLVWGPVVALSLVAGGGSIVVPHGAVGGGVCKDCAVGVAVVAGVPMD